MADIFISYKSSDRPRAETLKEWFESAGWTVWIDREIHVSREWEERIEAELCSAKVVVVLWGAEARRSEWVVREARTALEDGRLVQIHATGLPLLPPFESVQALRMQAWSGETAHTERHRLMTAVANRLGVDPPEAGSSQASSTAGMVEGDAAELVELVFYHCARRLEFQRYQVKGGYPDETLLGELQASSAGILEKIGTGNSTEIDDREGIFHLVSEGFDEQLQLLAPDPNRIE